MVCWGRRSRNLSQSMLWRRRCGRSPLVFRKTKSFFMGEKHFPGFQLFNKGRLRSCVALNETSEAARVRVGLCAPTAIVPPRCLKLLHERFSFSDSHISPRSCSNYYGSEQPLLCKRTLTMSNCLRL